MKFTYSLSILFIFILCGDSYSNSQNIESDISCIIDINNQYSDADNDGYTDYQEIDFGSDPCDSLSVIYVGGWPYNQEKNSLIDVGFKDCYSIPYGNGCECTQDSDCMNQSKCEILFTSQNCVPQYGAQLPRFIGIDQFGDSVDIYDFRDKNKMILVEISAMWSNASNVMAQWLSGNSGPIKSMRWWQDNFDQVKELIDSGQIYYIRFLHQGPIKDDIVTASDVAYWHDQFPHSNIINLTDSDALLKTWVRPTGYPCLMLFKSDMTLHTPAEGRNGDAQRRRGLKIPFEAIINQFNPQD